MSSEFELINCKNFEPEIDIGYCEALFDKYKRLKVATRLNVQNLESDGSFKVGYRDQEKVVRKKAIARELFKNCESFLKEKPREWRDLQRDI